jgi:hypothetical protein
VEEKVKEDKKKRLPGDEALEMSQGKTVKSILEHDKD